MSVKETAFPDLELELNATRTLLERLPDGRFDWKPHDKSWSLGELATHTASLLTWIVAILNSDEFDFADSPPPPEARTSREGVLAMYDENAARVREAFAATTDEDLDGLWTLRHGDTVLSSDPRYFVLRRFGVSHLVHHRAQLTVYLRQLDVPLPPLLGPTADEQPSFG